MGYATFGEQGLILGAEADREFDLDGLKRPDAGEV
jgi:hypothetical protein